MTKQKWKAHFKPQNTSYSSCSLKMKTSHLKKKKNIIQKFHGLKWRKIMVAHN